MKNVLDYLRKVDESPMTHNPEASGTERSFSKEYDWATLQFKELLDRGISSKRYNLYKTPHSFWLTSDTDEYMGHISGDYKTVGGKEAFLISESFSKLSGGFYVIMFAHIFKHTNIDYIFSDTLVSEKAVNSWKKRLSQSRNNAVVMVDGVIGEYRPNGDYWGAGKGNIRVGLGKNQEAIDLYETIMLRCKSKLEQYSTHRKLYETNDEVLDGMLYFEPLNKL